MVLRACIRRQHFCKNEHTFLFHQNTELQVASFVGGRDNNPESCLLLVLSVVQRTEQANIINNERQAPLLISSFSSKENGLVCF